MRLKSLCGLQFDAPPLVACACKHPERQGPSELRASIGLRFARASRRLPQPL
jgi:hypothetical protein